MNVIFETLSINSIIIVGFFILIIKIIKFNLVIVFFFSRFSENILHLKLLELTLENVFLM